MTRRSTWEADLAAYIAASKGLAFRYGESDCALFFAGAVLAMTGADPAAPFRGKYTNELGAAKALKQIGAGDLETTLDSLFERCPVGKLQRGDGVWNGEAVGVCMGSYALFVGRAETIEGVEVSEGLIRIPRAEWAGGWRVE
jgi:hypothetical protein